LPLRYDDLLVDVGYRVDLLVENAVIVELKAVSQLLPVHTAQILSYLRAGNYRLGFLLNFNTTFMRNGIKRLIHDPAFRPRAMPPLVPGISEMTGEDPLDLGI
jgi:GxxExxY protein